MSDQVIVVTRKEHERKRERGRKLRIKEIELGEMTCKKRKTSDGRVSSKQIRQSTRREEEKKSR